MEVDKVIDGCYTTLPRNLDTALDKDITGYIIEVLINQKNYENVEQSVNTSLV